MSLLKLQDTEIIIHGKPVILTKETLVSTCNWFADSSLKQIAEALTSLIRMTAQRLPRSKISLTAKFNWLYT